MDKLVKDTVIKVGDRVKIDEKYKGNRIWFTTEVYTIIELKNNEIKLEQIVNNNTSIFTYTAQ